MGLPKNDPQWRKIGKYGYKSVIAYHALPLVPCALSGVVSLASSWSPAGPGDTGDPGKNGAWGGSVQPL